MTKLTTRDERFAALAAALARAVNAGEMHVVDAGRVIRHELHRRKTNRAHAASHRSKAAQEVIDRYGASGERRPRNDSPDALHSDHVFPLKNDEIPTLTTQEGWLERIGQLDTVVCVTHDENLALELLERAGSNGWDKYSEAGIDVIAVQP